MTNDLSEREKAILGVMAQQGSVSVADLSRELSVSEVTIRSDLTNLELQGFLSRTHGGAVPSIHPHIIERQKLATDEKNRIAKAAAALVNDGSTIMIEAGTTTGLIPRYLFGKREIHIITNSVMAFTAAKANPALKITLAGGEYRNSTDSFVGPITEETMRRFNVSYAFVGTDGFSPKAGITTHLIEGGQIIKVMREKSRQLILVADSSKFEQTGVVSILPLSSIDMIITDSLPQEAVDDIQACNCSITLC